MILSELKIHNLRCISNAHLHLHKKFNLIIGANGSGKTSILEALYLLSCGHSFRSREIAPIISHEALDLTVFGKSFDDQRVSIQKSHSQPTLIKLNNELCNATSQLAYALPTQVFYSDLFQILDAGPSVRRSVLDWGLFHVKHEYLQLWKQYKKILKQRNALLRQQASYTHFIPWDQQLSLLAHDLDKLRADYCIQWRLEFAKILPKLTGIECNFDYFKGWDKKDAGKSLEQILEECYLADKQKGYTQYGPHNADICIEYLNSKAKHSLSRGQQKIILIALKLAQSLLLQKECIYLIDDFSAELDACHQSNLLSFLSTLNGQCIITNTYPLLFQGIDATVFNMAEGHVSRET